MERANDNHNDNDNCAHRLAVIAFALFVATVARAQYCTPGQAPDVVRVKLGTACGNPEKIEVRRNGDDKHVLFGTRTGGWWTLDDPFTDSIGSVVLCSSKLCGHASTCVHGVPKPEHAANGDKVCVAEYTFNCDEDGWTLGVQSRPAATLAYIRSREAQQQRGELKSSPLKPIEMCDLASDEKVDIVPQTKKSYSFKPIPVSYDELHLKKDKSWILGAKLLKDYVVFPKAARTQPQTLNEGTFVVIDLQELKLMIAPEKPAGGQR